MRVGPISEITINGQSFEVVNTYKSRNFSGALPNSNTYIKEVIYSDPATIVFWSDDTKTVCKCKSPDVYSEEVGLSLCVLKKIFGGTKLHQLMLDWIPDQQSMCMQKVTLKDVIKKNK